MSEDRGDNISPAQMTFLLYQNAMAELAAEPREGDELRPAWWDLIRRGFEAEIASQGHGWLHWFDLAAKDGDPHAIRLIQKVTELRLKA